MNIFRNLFGSAANENPPTVVLVEFLRNLQETVGEYEERLVPVVRGSLLMRRWFGERARPPGDIDLECFELPREEPLSEDELRYREDGFGEYGEFSSLVDFGKAMCRYAAQSTGYYQYHRDRQAPAVEFTQVDAPDDGDSLWTYGTPGRRYYTGWVWHAGGGARGRLQIDLAEAGAYTLDEVGTAEIEFEGADGSAVTCLAYTQEMLLAAKLSWLLRGFERSISKDGNLLPPTWLGEPKDLFDAHLLLEKGQLNAADFQNVLLAVGREDRLNWRNLEAIFDVRRTDISDKHFKNWPPFASKYPQLSAQGPAAMLAEVAERLEPLLGDFYRVEENPFLAAINDEPTEEASYVIYADWLEERGDARAEFLRCFVDRTFGQFADGRSAPSEQSQQRLKTLFAATSKPWLHRLFGDAERYQAMARQIEDGLAHRWLQFGQ